MENKIIPWEVRRRGLACITETNLNRIMRHGEHGFIVISANRGEIHSTNSKTDLTGEYKKYLNQNKLEDTKENGNTWLAKRNKEADSELKSDIIKSKYAFTPVFGGYHGSDDVTDSFEPSYIVYNHRRGGGLDYGDFDKLYKLALEWCKKYKQDSVYIQAPGEAPIYVDGDGSQCNSESSKDFKFNRDNETYYTTTKRDKTDPQRFTADIRFDEMYIHRGASTYFDRMRRNKLGEVFVND